MIYTSIDNLVKNRLSFCRQDFLDILTAEGYWSPVDRKPTAAGLAVSVFQGGKYLWDMDFAKALVKKYSMIGHLKSYLIDFIEAQVYCYKIRTYPSMFSADERNTWRDVVPIRSADLIIQLRIWGLTRRTSFDSNLTRFNRWLRRTASEYGFEKYVVPVQRQKGGCPGRRLKTMSVKNA